MSSRLARAAANSSAREEDVTGAPRGETCLFLGRAIRARTERVLACHDLPSAKLTLPGGERGRVPSTTSTLQSLSAAVVSA